MSIEEGRKERQNGLAVPLHLLWLGPVHSNERDGAAHGMLCSHHAALSRRNARGVGGEEEIRFLSTLETKAALFINCHKY